MAALYRMHVDGWPLDRALDELIRVKGERPEHKVIDFLETHRPGTWRPALRATAAAVAPAQ
jgi:hypothetical protein